MLIYKRASTNVSKDMDRMSRLMTRKPEQYCLSTALALCLSLFLAVSITLLSTTAYANKSSIKRAELAANEAKLSKMLNELNTIKKH